MTIEERLADMSKIIRKKKGCRKTRNERNRSAEILFPLQRLYMSCLDVFKGVGTVPSSTDVKKNCRILDERAVMTGEESERYWWLEEIEVPKESETEGIEGPQIIEMSYSS